MLKHICLKDQLGLIVLTQKIVMGPILLKLSYELMHIGFLDPVLGKACFELLIMKLRIPILLNPFKLLRVVIVIHFDLLR